MSPVPPGLRHIAHLHLHTSPAHLGEQRWAEVLETLTGITPAVQVIPPTAVQLDLTGALRYHACSPHELTAQVMLRLAGLWGSPPARGSPATA